LALRTPGQRLVAAARAAGVPAALSGDAGGYLCNYLCWRASEAGCAVGGPQLVAFVHVPQVGRANLIRSVVHRPPFTRDDLIRAGEAIVVAAIAAVRAHR
jgi:pyroglutamyl-peptidase